MRQTDSRLTCCIAITAGAFEESQSTHIYMYSSANDITLVDSARLKKYEWDGFEHFEEALSASEIAQLAINLGIRLQFTRGSKHDLALEMWDTLCSMAHDRRSTGTQQIIKRDPLTGKKQGRKKQNLGTRRYHLVEKAIRPTKKEMLDDAPMTTRQAKKIWEFFIDEYLATGSPYMTEARMQNIVNDRAEELRTKQDPWRIFCYYRPELIDCQLIKMEG